MGEEGYPSFVCVIAKDGSEEIMELPQEEDGTLLLSTVQAQFPTAVGLKYKSSTGGWRGIRAENNVLDPPYGGWGEGIYTITESDALKRKSDNQAREQDRKSRRPSKLLEDLIVLGLPFSTSEEELNAFFTEKCGELSFCQLKTDRVTNKSRGFGFIRFKAEEGAKEALRGHHEIDGRKLEVRLSRKPDEVPMKLFVGRLPTGTNKQDVDDLFSEFGDLTDVFVPTDRGFGFVTFASKEDAMRVLRTSHNLGGSQLHVTPAQPKEDRGPGRMENFGVDGVRNPPMNTSFGQVSYGQNAGQSSHNMGYGGNFHQQSAAQGNFQQQPAPQKDVAAELKDMLMTLINTRK